MSPGIARSEGQGMACCYAWESGLEHVFLKDMDV